MHLNEVQTKGYHLTYNEFKILKTIYHQLVWKGYVRHFLFKRFLNSSIHFESFLKTGEVQIHLWLNRNVAN
jgi:hypothetical protein